MAQEKDYEKFQIADNRLPSSNSSVAMVPTIDRDGEPNNLCCRELWAGNEKAHQSFQLSGCQADVLIVPQGLGSGGDLSAIFLCSDNFARVLLADCVGHGYVASDLARHVHHLLHKFEDVRDSGSLLGALNKELTLNRKDSAWNIQLTTVVTAGFDSATGELNFADAAHPRMLLRRNGEEHFSEIGRELESLPLGYVTGERYQQRSIRLEPGDLLLAFSDGATEVESTGGIELAEDGLARFAVAAASNLGDPLSLHHFSETLLDDIYRYHGGSDLEDDITLLTLQCSTSACRGR
jgi:phosphoserine phosphatase RsbU/P